MSASKGSNGKGKVEALLSEADSTGAGAEDSEGPTSGLEAAEKELNAGYVNVNGLFKEPNVKAGVVAEVDMRNAHTHKKTRSQREQTLTPVSSISASDGERVISPVSSSISASDGEVTLSPVHIRSDSV
jgi:hypothetical protein